MGNSAAKQLPVWGITGGVIESSIEATVLNREGLYDFGELALLEACSMEANNKIFKALAAGLGLLGLIATAAGNFHHFHSALEEYYWHVLAVAWVLSIVAVWPQPSSKRVRGPQETYRIPLLKSLLKYRWVILITIVFLGVASYRYHIIYTPEPGDRPVIRPGEVRTQPSPSRSEWSFGLVHAQTRSNGPRLLQFNLIPEKTSYIKADNRYDLPGETMTRVVARECDPNFRVAPALKALRSYAKSAGKESLLKFISNEDQLKRLAKDHPGRVTELMPSKAELEKMNESDAAVILSWKRNCVGLLFPVFLVVIENPSAQDVVVLRIKYNYHRILGVTGVQQAAPLYPTASYVHKLEPVGGGSQQIDLLPGFNIPARQNGSFELQLWSDISADKYVVMDIEFVTNRGTTKTDTFVLGFRSLPYK